MYSMKKKYVLQSLLYGLLSFFLLVGSVSAVYAQSSVTGQVVDEEGISIPGVSVVEKGTTIGVVTDIDGNYSLNVSSDAVLQFSFVGMQTKEESVNGRSVIDVTLETDAISLEEVVAIGYGTQKKSNLTGAVSQVKMDEVLGDRPVTSVAAALQGTVPGLRITGASIPGEAPKLNIRGTTSIASLGDTPLTDGEPLVLIDNVPGSIDLLNPEDIETVSVLKDAASAAIYGARGAFGVILITTKKGKKGDQLRLNYNTNFAFQKAIAIPEHASLEQYLLYRKDYSNTSIINNVDVDKYLAYLREYNSLGEKDFLAKYSNAYFEDGRFIPEGENNYYYLKENNPQKAMLDDYGFQQTHNVSATGGSEKMSYRMALGYTDQDGPLVTDKDKNERINLTSYVSTELTSWLTQSIDVSFTKHDRSYVETNGLYGTAYPVITPSGSMPESDNLEGRHYPIYSPENILRYSDPSTWQTENTRLFSRTAIHPLEGFEAVFEYTYETKNRDYKRYTNNEKMITISNQLDGLSADPRYYNTKDKTALNSLNLYGTYQKSFIEKHNLKFMLGYSQETRDYEELNVDRNDMNNPLRPSFSNANGTPIVSDLYRQYAIRSGFFRFNYDYEDKYLLEVNGRYDGSSKFPKETRFGFFPSVSLGWRLDQESFMDWSNSWLNMAKLRASYGELGNQSGVGEYGYLPSMDPELVGWIVDGQLPTTLNPPALVRTDYSWEVVETLDFGIDLSFFNNRLSTVFDWYERNTIGMLAPGLQLPGAVGANAPDQNAADLSSKGWELSMQWRDNIKEWRYNIGFNIADSKTKITKYDNEAGLFYDPVTNSNFREGMEIGEIWGYVTDGYYTADDFVDFNDFVLKEGVPSIEGYTQIRPGDVKFVNLDGDEDNVISKGDDTAFSPGDRKIIGNSTPRYQYGINGGVGWKNFDLSFFLQGVGKRDYWINSPFNLTSSYHYVAIYSDVLDYWKPVDMAAGDYTAINPNAELPRIYDTGSDNHASNFRTQTKYLQDASYLRMKNITLSYTFPQMLVQKVGLRAGKVFFSGENLFTISKLNAGIDPERLNWGYPFYATYSFGINVTL